METLVWHIHRATQTYTFLGAFMALGLQLKKHTIGVESPYKKREAKGLGT